MKKTVITISLTGALSCAVFTAYAGAAPTDTPQVFAPKLISGPAGGMSPAFTPDGNTVYYMADGGNHFTILKSRRVNKHWSKPVTPSFSGKWRDLDPAMSPDGSFLVFVSNRPAQTDGNPIDAVSGSKVRPGKGMNLWRVNRKDDGWGTPFRLPDAVNHCNMTFAPTIAADGSIYFIGCGKSGHRLRLLRSQYRDGHYLAPVAVNIGSQNSAIRDPAIAPDQSFIVFSLKKTHSKQPYRINIAFHKNGHWTKPIDLGDAINRPGNNMANRLGPGGRTLYFSAENKIWRIPMTPWPGSQQTDMAAKPQIFAPGEISTTIGVDCLSFTPDGNTVVFHQEPWSTGGMIMVSHRINGHWTSPRIASFSGRWHDHDPAVSPDGSYIVFTSNRPDKPGDRNRPHGHLWRVNRTTAGWSAPIRLPDTVNFGPNIYAPSVAANGDLYFQSNNNASRKFHIYRSAWRNGHYQKPAQLNLLSAGMHELDPAVSPNGSFIVFDAGHDGSHKPDHLYIAFRQGAHWSHPIDLGKSIDRYQPWGAHLGPDGTTLYFSSSHTEKAAYPRSHAQAEADLARIRTWDNGTSHIWRISLEPWLRAHRRRSHH